MQVGVYYPLQISRIFSFPPEVRHCVRTQTDVLVKIREYKTQWKPVWKLVMSRVIDWSNKSRKLVELWLWDNWQTLAHGRILNREFAFLKPCTGNTWVQAVTPKGCAAHCNTVLNIGLEGEPAALLFTWWNGQKTFLKTPLKEPSIVSEQYNSNLDGENSPWPLQLCVSVRGVWSGILSAPGVSNTA